MEISEATKSKADKVCLRSCTSAHERFEVLHHNIPRSKRRHSLGSATSLEESISVVAVEMVLRDHAKRTMSAVCGYPTVFYRRI